MNLQMRMMILVVLMFAILYGVVAGVGTYLGAGNVTSYIIMAIGITLFQYLIGPNMVTTMMKVRWVSPQEEPELHQMIEEMSQEAGLPKPKVGISQVAVPNAFAFGRSIKDGRICITSGMRQLLNKEELRAVIGHELSHIKHRDMIVITVLSVIPLILYWLGIRLMYGGASRDRENRGSAALIGMVAFLLYFISNLLVLYGSRIREYYADQGSVQLGNPPHQLASALYKLTYGSAKLQGSRIGKQELSEVEGFRAFFLNDIALANQEFKTLQELDQNLSGTIDAQELLSLREKKVAISPSERIMEIFTT
ncbi:MAG TPA: zinc metalloprotease HtpX, partial [Atribacterota bacterium]|nr:zinc metalloprotease HtpX [Atribacterota bacterium]